VSPSPFKERGSKERGGFAPLRLPAFGVGVSVSGQATDATRVAWVGKDEIGRD